MKLEFHGVNHTIMANLNLHHHWVCTFTNTFLEEFYGTTAYFNFETIAFEAKPKILARMQTYYDHFFSWQKDSSLSLTEQSETVKILQKELKCVQVTGNVYDFEGGDYEFDWSSLDYDFVQDLFEVTAKPMSLAYSLCKGDAPNGDCFSGQETAMNVKYNCMIIQYLIDHYVKV